MALDDKLSKLSSAPTPSVRPFGDHQEEAIIALALDFPEFFGTVGRFVQPEMFGNIRAQYVIAAILNLYSKYNTIPTREFLADYLKQQLTEDDDWEPILKLVYRESNPREVPMLKDSLIGWAKKRAYGLLYSDLALDAFARSDFEYLDNLLQSANRITDVGDNCFWLFDQFKILLEPTAIPHRSTGWSQLDKHLNNGGPSPKEVVCFMAATNVGKSIVLCNVALNSLSAATEQGVGQNVLLITFELDTLKTAMRVLGAMTKVALSDMLNHKQYVERIVGQHKTTYNRDLCIYELPPDECSVDHVYSILDHLRRVKGWRPDVIVIDYLELMTSRHTAYNADEYLRQKHVANEIRGLAKNENVLIYTATQTNRSGTDSSAPVDLDKSAESFGKNMPLDYVISLNQTESERNGKPPRLRFWIAKNRNGPKHLTVQCTIDYDTMHVKEVL